MEIDGSIFEGTISNTSFVFDLGTSSIAENRETNIYFYNEDGDLFVDNIGMLE